MTGGGDRASLAGGVADGVADGVFHLNQEKYCI